MKESLRHQAVALREQGWSYSVIAWKLRVAKSTLSGWLRSLPFTPNRIEVGRISKARAASAEGRSARRRHDIELIRREAARDMGDLQPRDIWMIGIGLYMGEGSKSQEDVNIVNSDPDILRLAVIWLRDACEVPPAHFRVTLHAYPDTEIGTATSYWSEVLGIPTSQFANAVIDRRRDKRRKNRRKTPYGTAHLRVRSMGIASCGVRLHRRIMGWLQAAYEKSRA